jgi:phage-related protein
VGQVKGTVSSVQNNPAVNSIGSTATSVTDTVNGTLNTVTSTVSGLPTTVTSTIDGLTNQLGNTLGGLLGGTSASGSGSVNAGGGHLGLNIGF